MPELNGLKSNKNFVGIYRGIVTRCPSSEPDPDGKNKIQICIPALHGKVKESKIGSGSNKGDYPWAMMSFMPMNGSGESSYSSDESGTDGESFTDDSDLKDVQKTAYDSNYKPTKYSISSADRTELERIVMGEYGASYVGSCLIAQCLRDALTNGYAKSPQTIRSEMGYDGYMTSVGENAKKAVKYIFDEGGYAVHHRILVMYNNKMCSSSWHESQVFVVQLGDVRFFDYSSNNRSLKSTPSLRTPSDDSGDSSSGGSFTPRLSFDDVKPGTKAYDYFYTNNIYKGGVSLPNCTAYAYGRASEILGKDSGLPMNDAGQWVNSLNGKYSVSDEPQLGDVCCWSRSGQAGHVAVVEEVSGDQITISQSGYRDYNRNDPNFWTSTVYKSTSGDGSGKYNKWAFSDNYSLQGFIHIGSFSGSSSYNMGDGESGSSANPYPEKDDTVWVMFEGGDVRYPTIIGFMKPKVSAGGYSDGSDIDDGTLAELAAEIIFAEEGTYDTIVGNDNGGLSLGKLGWHEDNAKKIVKRIYESDKSQFSSELISKLNSSWSGFIISEGQSIYTTLKKVLQTSASKTVQDKAMLEDIETYFEHARKLGVTDNAALIYAADLHNQGGERALKLCVDASSKPITLDSLYKGSLTTYMGNYKSRRDRVYNKIKELEKSGKLDTVSSGTGEAARVVAIAKKEIGYKAADYGGKTKYGEWYGQYTGGSSSSFAYSAWCAMFTQWCAYKAGVTKDRIYVTACAGPNTGPDGYKAKGMWHNRSGYTPKPGDFIHYTWGHVGIVEKVANGKVYTIEGNTGSSPGCVGRHEYDINWSSINGYARPKYK